MTPCNWQAGKIWTTLKGSLWSDLYSTMPFSCSYSLPYISPFNNRVTGRFWELLQAFMLLAMLFPLPWMPLHAFIHLPNSSQCSKVTLPTLLGRYVVFLHEDFTWPKLSSEYILDVYYIVLVSGSSKFCK